MPEELASEAVRVERKMLGELADLQYQTLVVHRGTRLVTFRGGRIEARPRRDWSASARVGCSSAA